MTSTIDTLIAYMHGEMTANAVSSMARSIKRKLTGSPAVRYLPGGGIVNGVLYADGLRDWKNQVNYGAPWDHKPYILKTYGKTALDPATGLNYPFDTWSNIHYGYVGRAVTLSAWTLKAGAGVAQYRSSTGTPDGYLKRRFEKLGDADVFGALDFPEDQEAIMIGCELWDGHGIKVTQAQFKAAVVARAKELGAV